MAKAEKERVDVGGEKRFHFDFAGKFFEDSEKEYFDSYVKENKLEEYITYHGIVGGESKRNLLKECYIFALPTRYPNEGQPISILEAMGNGMFIISTDHAGIPDIVGTENGIAYFTEGCSDETRTKIYCYIAACGLLWSNWCEYKRNLGVEFGEYSLRQYRYAKDYYRIVQEELKKQGEEK